MVVKKGSRRVVKCCGARWDKRIKNCPRCGKAFSAKATDKEIINERQSCSNSIR